MGGTPELQMRERKGKLRKKQRNKKQPKKRIAMLGRFHQSKGERTEHLIKCVTLNAKYHGGDK